MILDALESLGLFVLVAAAIRIATPLIYASLGEVISEKSGVMNLGVEGIMLIGASAGFYVAYKLEYLFIGILVGLLSGVILGCFMGYFCVYLRANQTVTGLSLWIFGMGMSSFIFRVGFAGIGVYPRVTPLKIVTIPYLSEIPILGRVLFQHNILVYFAFILVPIVWFVLNKTEFGLDVRAVGEHPKAAETLGINVLKTRFIAVVIGSALAGVGGVFMTLGSLGTFMDNMIQYRGFIALAIVIFARWNPLYVPFGAFFFGFMDALQTRLQIIGSVVPYQLLVATPYIAIAIMLVVFNLFKKEKQSVGPASLTIPYEG